MRLLKALQGFPSDNCFAHLELSFNISAQIWHLEFSFEMNEAVDGGMPYQLVQASDNLPVPKPTRCPAQQLHLAIGAQ